MGSEAVIIGAGPAGLTAAYELRKLGWRSTILEADNQVGGISRTVNFRGYRFDIGGHRFFSKVELVNQLWQEILGEDFLLRPRLSRIHYRGHFFDYPLTAMNALAGLGPVEAALVCISYAKAKLFPDADETSFEQWVANRFGYRLYRIFFKTYTEKVWGIPCREISADWAAQRIKNLSLIEALRSALLGKNRTSGGEIVTTLIDQFHYPRFGPGQMWERCELLLGQRNCPTIRGMPVARIRHHNGRVVCVEAGNGEAGGRDEFGGEQFISSMPLRELVFALDPPPPPEVLKAAEGLRYRDYLTVVLIVKRESVFPDNWIYIHTPEVKMGRIQNYKNWSPSMVPDASRTSLGLEYFLWESDPEWDWPDERLIELGKRECTQIGLIDPSEVEDGTVVRMKKAYPVYDHAYRANVDTIRRYLATIPNLQTVGRNGLHRYNNQDHSMLTAVYAARNIVGERHDVWAVNTEMEYHEEDRRKAAPAGEAVRPPVEERAVPTRVHVPVARPLPHMSAEQIIETAFARLDAVALGVAVGAVWGLGLFAATAILLLKGGVLVGRNLSLLSNYLPGYSVSWTGALIGGLEAALGGFAFGCAVAMMRNWGVAAYAFMLKRRAETEESRDLLDKV